MVFDPDSANFLGTDAEGSVNALLKYLQHQSPEILAQVARSASPDVKQIISHNVQGLVGMLPSEGFNVKITTDRENLAGLLASAMMTGYFLRQMEQRMELEGTLAGSLPLYKESSEDDL
jgi:CheY-specific phosphatase CheX